MEDNAEKTISMGTFVQHLTYFLKIGIFVNMGTDNDALLERCIKLYNKYKTVEAAEEMSEGDSVFMRRCIKRINLILKVDDEGRPLDILDKENQVRMMGLKGHSSLAEDDSYYMIKHAKQYALTILSDVPLIFIVRGKYQEFTWQYTRALFYLSQYLLAAAGHSTPEKIKVSDDALDHLANIFEKIDTLEAKINLNQLMAKNSFLNKNLVKTGINEEKVNLACLEVKDIFRRKGLDQDPSMDRMIESIAGRLTDDALSGDNIVGSMIGIAELVANEMRGDLENNPEKFQKTIFAITEVFKEALNDPSTNSEDLPDELRTMFNQLADIAPIGPDGQAQVPDEEAIINALDRIVNDNGLNRDDFYGSIRDIQGGIDVDKLESLLKTVSKGKIGEAQVITDEV
ncbi:Hypothetical protein MVR_LOCUS122 [uncultured virus]|nr:Hypothetical protein MVR_LOCUS122 [uncultured virus]